MPANYMELETDVLALPIAERCRLAQRLWESLDDSEMSSPTTAEAELVAAVRRRDEELSSGSVQGLSHDEVLKAARDAIRCA
jgi:putative addiction module component (TIGR02574 family)